MSYKVGDVINGAQVIAIELVFGRHTLITTKHLTATRVVGKLVLPVIGTFYVEDMATSGSHERKAA